MTTTLLIGALAYLYLVGIFMVVSVTMAISRDYLVPAKASWAHVWLIALLWPIATPIVAAVCYFAWSSAPEEYPDDLIQFSTRRQPDEPTDPKVPA